MTPTGGIPSLSTPDRNISLAPKATLKTTLPRPPDVCSLLSRPTSHRNIFPGPGSRTTALTPVLELAADTVPAALAFDVVADGKSERITGQPGPGRFTLRYLLPGVERSRELPGGPRIVIADDSVFSLFLVVAWHAPLSPDSAPTHVTAILPRGASRAELTLTDLGIVATTVNRDPAVLRHILIAGGPMGPVHVWLDRDGRLMKVEIPDRSLRAERLPG